MKLPEKLKWLYWVLLVAGGGWLNWWRLSAKPINYPTSIDLVAFGAWILLLLVPLFDEIKIGEFAVKRAVQEAKAEIKDQILSVRAELQSIRVQAQATSQVFIGPVPSESALSTTRRDIEAAVPEVRETPVAPPSVPEYVPGLATLRVALEGEVRRIARTWLFNTERQRPLVPFWEILRDLEAEGAIPTPLKQGARDVYNICSAALHGGDLTAQQISFAEEIGPGIVAALKKIRA